MSAELELQKSEDQQRSQVDGNENPHANHGDITSWRLIVFILTPILLLPLPLISHGAEAKCAYVILLMTVYWMMEVIPLCVTALLPVALFPLLGVSSASITASSYFKDTNFLIFGSLLLAVATEASGLQTRVALRILLWFGVRPQWLILGFMVAAGFVSMWISNTAACALMMPILHVVLEEILQQRRLRKRVKTVLHANGELVDLENKSHAKPTSNLLGSGTLTDEELGICRAAAIGVAFGSSVGGIGIVIGATPNLILVGQLAQYYPKQNEVTFASWLPFGMPMQILFLLIGWLWLLVFFVGWRSICSSCAKKTEDDVVMAKALRREYENLGPIRFEEGAVAFWFILIILLWFFREPIFIPGWSIAFENGFVSDATPVILISVVLFIFPSTISPFLWWRKRKIVPNSAATGPTASKRIVSGLTFTYKPLMTWHYMQEKFPWAVILLMGGGFALADGVKKSGLSTWLGCALQSGMMHIKPALVVLIFLILMTVVSEFASNSATASIFIPILLSVAESLHINPLYFGMSAAIGSSFGFMLPVATPPNMIVFEKFKALDIISPKHMIKAGLGLDIICIVVAFGVMHTFGIWVYHFNVYPSWGHGVSNSTNYTACT